ncbi:MAG: exodeoxyribonuclease VII small subunit [Gemmatimonadales bacterium]|nr:exodeoxyribonuclease VII small subunit [Gemmatimonadales bacterium]
MEKVKKRIPAKKLSFGEAVGEVEAILAELEAEKVDIDTLGQEVKRAVELIQVCRQKLEKTDSEVRGLVAGLETGDPDPVGDENEDVPY